MDVTEKLIDVMTYVAYLTSIDKDGLTALHESEFMLDMERNGLITVCRPAPRPGSYPLDDGYVNAKITPKGEAFVDSHPMVWTL